MQMTQKRLATKISYEFGLEELEYRVEDNSGSRDLSISYGSIPGRSRVLHESNQWLKNVGFLWCALGVGMIGLAAFGERPVSGSAFWLLVGILCLAFYRLTRSSYTVFDHPDGEIYILQDKKHDTLMQEIDRRRREALLNWLKADHFKDDPAHKAEAIEWLVKQKVLSRAEADQQLSFLSEAKKLSAPDDGQIVKH